MPVVGRSAIVYKKSYQRIKFQMRVLIVDDLPRARQSMKALLEAWRQFDEINEATNGEEAIQLSDTFQPELVLMDACMPVMNGLQAIKQIKATWSHIKIIVLSMYQDLKVQALAAGADAFVCRSDPPEEFRKILAEILQKSSDEAEYK
jgi:DNA-binding NarL/FixJ family response regulator